MKKIRGNNLVLTGIYLVISVIISGIYSCSTTRPGPSNEKIHDDKLEITILDSRTKEPIKQVKIYIEGADFEEVREII